jgi:hypothetical protein
MTSISRRFFLVLAGIFVTGQKTHAKTMKPKFPSLAHHVFFWLKNPESTADRDKLIQGIRSLEKIETVRGLHIGLPASTEKRDVVDGSYSVCELMFFDDPQGEKTYQEHPIHKKFVEEHSHLWSKVVVYDSLEGKA